MVAPSGVVNGPRVLAGVALLREMGFQVEGAKDVIGRSCQVRPYLAGSDRERVREFEAAFFDPLIDGVVCARGGYGAMRLLRHLNGERLREHIKPLLGFSDITALNGYFASVVGVSSWHGPVVQSLPVLKESAGGESKLESVRDALQGGWTRSRFEGLQVLRPGPPASGPLLGGNLSLVHALAGSPWYPSLKGAILFLEDVGEVPYRIDRMLTSLLLRGALDGVAGLVLGDLGGAVSRYIEAARCSAVMRSLVLDVTATAGVPVLCGLPVGHGDENAPIPFGTMSTLSAAGGEGWLEVSSAVLKQ